MLFSVELLDLLLYCVQQLGVMLAVGAETIVLVSYIVSMYDRVIEEAEVRFSRAVHRALLVGLSCVVLSGLAIVWLHLSLEEDVVFEPVFLFKWLLIVTLIGMYVWQRRKPFSHFLLEGVVGGTWYALFLIHILAPQASWGNLAVLYILFVVGFVALWSALVAMSKTRSVQPAPKIVTQISASGAIPPKAVTPVVSVLPKMTSAPQPRIQTPPPVIVPRPIVSPPLPKPIPVPVAPVVPATSAPIVTMNTKVPDPPPVVLSQEPHHSHWLPAIHVMPKNEAQLQDKSHITPLSRINKPA
ncbi:MAG: hypothetical protein V4436_01510 [Patescibacteria group bacterium]